jgi:hypothetical protein
LDSISSDGTSISKLVDWANYFVKPKAKKAWAGSGEFLPGEWCQFCRAKAQCRARADFNNQITALEFREPALLSDEEFDLVLSRADSMKTYINDVQTFALNRAVNESVTPAGYKLTTTKTHRKIGDQALAATVLIEKGFKEHEIYEPQSLKSIAQLEKLGQKGQVAAALGALILRPDGAPKLVKDKTTEEDFS